jgi:hypothetical protein
VGVQAGLTLTAARRVVLLEPFMRAGAMTEGKALGLQMLAESTRFQLDIDISYRGSDLAQHYSVNLNV